MTFKTVKELRKYQDVYDIKELLDQPECIGGSILTKDFLNISGYESFNSLAIFLTKCFCGGEFPKSNDFYPIISQYDDNTKTSCFLIYKP